jgi:8-oxo-dGTP pyrophosphatase MutT (NUDIX family)
MPADSVPEIRIPVIRVKAVCVLRDGDEVGLISGSDPGDGRAYLIPPGGAVEFGESAMEAARRELHEELTIEIDRLRPLGVFESRFTWDGKPWHEIVFAFIADLPAGVPRPRSGVESDGRPFPLVWLPLADLGRHPVVPVGLAAALRAAAIPG